MSYIKDLLELASKHKCAVVPIIFIVFMLSASAVILEYTIPRTITAINEKIPDGYIRDIMLLLAPIISIIILLLVPMFIYIVCVLIYKYKKIINF